MTPGSGLLQLASLCHQQRLLGPERTFPAALKNIIIAGNGFNGQGAVIRQFTAVGIANEGVHNLTLAGDASISASNRFDIYGGTGGGC